MKKSWIILGISLLFLLGSIYLSGRLSIKSNMEDMLPKDSQVVQASTQFNQYFEGQEIAYLLIGYNPSSMDAEAFHVKAIAYMESMSLQLEQQDFVLTSLYRVDRSKMKPYSWAYMELEDLVELEDVFLAQDPEGIQQKLQLMTTEMDDLQQYEYMINDAEDHYLMMVQPYLDNNEYDLTRNAFYDGMSMLLNDLQEDSAFEGLEVGLTGGAFIQDLEADNIAFRGLGGTLFITLAAILLVVILFFGQIKLPALTLYPLILGSLMAAACAYVIYGSINMFSVSFALLLLGLGIDFAVHFLTRYQELYQKGIAKDDAITKAISSTGKSIVIGALTTAFAFFTFGIAKFRAFEQMGIISGLGILLLCLCMLLIVPALLRIADRKSSKISRFDLSFKWLGSVGVKVIKWAPWFVGCILISGLLVSQTVIQTKVNGDVSAIYPEDIPSRINALKIEEAFDLNTNTVSVYFDDMKGLLDGKEQLELREDVDFTQSILDYMPQNQEAKLAIAKKITPYLDAIGTSFSQEMVLEEMTLDQLPEEIIKNYVGREGKLRLDIVPSVDLYQEEACNKLIQGVLDITDRYPVGMPIIMNEVTYLVKTDMVWISLLCLIVVLSFSMVAFRHFGLGLLTIVPILLTLYFTLGLAPIFKIDLNLFSIAAFPLIIGIGIDSAIHLLHRLVEEGSENLQLSFQHTGRAILLTTITTMIGFGSLATINHPGMKSFGLIVVLGMALNVIFTFVMIPIGYRMIHSKTLS